MLLRASRNNNTPVHQDDAAAMFYQTRENLYVFRSKITRKLAGLGDPIARQVYGKPILPIPSEPF
ncbi:MAG: hypothetical protein ACTSP4_01680 [Candidatus Hodarchaeales archaeon]